MYCYFVRYTIVLETGEMFPGSTEVDTEEPIETIEDIRLIEDILMADVDEKCKICIDFYTLLREQEQ